MKTSRNGIICLREREGERRRKKERDGERERDETLK